VLKKLKNKTLEHLKADISFVQDVWLKSYQ